MANSSILGGVSAPVHPDGKNVDALGPSDSSDSGSDVQGERSMPTAPDNAGEWGAVVTEGGNDSDASGTGERASAGGESPRDGDDILPDRIVDVAGEEDESDPDALDASDVLSAEAEDVAADDEQVDQEDDEGDDTERVDSESPSR